MRKVSDLKELEHRIEELEKLREIQKQELQANFRQVAHELSPATIIRKGVREIVSEPGIRATAMDTAIGSGLGFLGRKLFVGRSGNIFKKLAGSAIQFIVANVVRNKIPEIRSRNKKVNHPGEL